MTIENKNLCTNEIRKIGLIITRAVEDGMDLSGYGTADVNTSSGNVYLWLEGYRACLYIGLDGTNKIHYNRTCGNCGQEYDVPRKKREDDMRCKKCGEDM